MRTRRAALFLISMAIPCLVVFGLGARMIAQQGELHARRLDDERRFLTTEFARALRERLENTRHSADQSLTTLTATVHDGQLRLPWENTNTAADAPNQAFETALALAEREEWANRLDAAEVAVRRALQLARTSRQRSFAELVHARILIKSGRPDAGRAVYLELLGASDNSVDAHGVPFAFYAAERLLEDGGITDEIAGEIEKALERALTGPATMLSAVGWYQARAVAEASARAGSLSGRVDYRQAVASRIVDSEHALALQRELPSLLSVWRGSPTAWVAHGSPMWLVGFGERSNRSSIVAVRAEEVTSAIHAELPRLSNHTLTTTRDAGEWLGGEFPGLKVDDGGGPLPNVSELWWQRAFYVSTLVAVLSVTMFGAYLLWRDVNRDLRVAALRSQFVASVTHELKTPLTAIRMFAETLRDGRGDVSARHEYLETIVNESERLTRLLNNVLDFSKIEQGRKTYRLEPRSVGDIVRVAARAMAYPLEQQGFMLHLEIQDDLPPVGVDADALEQAILNLLSNAMKYSGTSRDIGLRLSRDGNHVVIAVRDAGVGIPLHERTRIFEKFHRLETAETQRVPGTGLGLALVDHIVQAHGGSIRVDSTPGQGSTFSICLPLAGAPS